MAQHDPTTSPDDGVATDTAAVRYRSAPERSSLESAGSEAELELAELELAELELAELLARIGDHLVASRVELHRFQGSDYSLVGTWRPGGAIATDIASPIPTVWFPWNLGNLHAADHFFVRNAARLLLHPSSMDTVASLGMASALQIAVRSGARPLGAVCAYWRTERSSWNDSTAAPIMDLAQRALDLPLPRSSPRPRSL